MLLSSVALNSGVLTLIGDSSSNNTASVTVSGSSISTTLNGTTKSYTASTVKSLDYNGGSGVDVVTIDSSVSLPSTIDTLAGNDTIKGGSGIDLVNGGDGDDLIYGYAGNDTLYGNNGNDYLYGGNGDDKLDGNYGQDFADGETGNDKIYNTATATSVDLQVLHPGETGTPTPSGDPTAPAITTLELVNADTDDDIRVFTSGSTIDLDTVGNNLTVRADTTDVTKSVRFTLDGVTKPTENSRPFALFGDNGGDLIAWTPSLGTHTLTATAYTGAGATGTASSTSTISFTVTDSGIGSGGGTTTPPPAPPTSGGTNSAPAVKISSPTANTSMWGPGSFLITTFPTDSDGTVQRVDFYNGSSYLGTAADAPFTYAWTGVAPGTYSLTAIAFDDDGAKTTSAAVSVKVVTPTVSHNYVVSTSGSDSNSGTAAAPFRTINKAAAVAKAGDVVLIKNGTYREGITVMNSGTSSNPIIFKAETTGGVIVDGADTLNGLTKDTGTTKPIYSATWNYDFFVGNPADGKRYSGSTGGIGYAEQAMYNGTLLKRVLNYADLAAGTFYINYSTNKMSVYLPGGVAPTSGSVMASTRSRLLQAKNLDEADYVEVDGITFQHAANFPQSGAIRTWDGWRLNDVTVQYMNALGVTIAGSNVRANHVVAQYNGQCGLGGSSIVNSILEDCVTYKNNTKNYSATWESGGGKFSRVNGLYFLNYDSEENSGFGLWFDIENRNVSIVGGTFHDNHTVPNNDQTAAGIMIEVNPGPFRIDGAKIYDNDGSGVLIAESQYVSVRNSTFSNNAYNISLRDIANRAYTTANIRIYNNKIDDWRNVGISITVRNSTGTTPASHKIYVDGNTYDGASTNGVLLKWDGNYETLSEIHTLGIEAKGTTAAINFVQPIIDTLL